MHLVMKWRFESILFFLMSLVYLSLSFAVGGVYSIACVGLCAASIASLRTCLRFIKQEII